MSPDIGRNYRTGEWEDVQSEAVSVCLVGGKAKMATARGLAGGKSLGWVSEMWKKVANLKIREPIVGLARNTVRVPLLFEMSCWTDKSEEVH